MMKRPGAYTIFLLYEGLQAFGFGMVFTIAMFYWVERVNLTALELVLNGTALEVTIFLFEIPTGVVADVYSRRLSVIIGVVIIGIGFIISAVPNFPVILVGQVFWGVGFTFTSGAANAWISDEIGEGRAAEAFLRGRQIAMACKLIAMPISVALALIELYLPLVVGGLIFIGLGIVLVLTMPEAGFVPLPPEERDSWRAMKRTTADGIAMVQRRPILITILMIGLLVGMFSEGYDRLWPAHLLRGYDMSSAGFAEPVVLFGIITMVGSALSIGATEIVRRKVDIRSQTRIIGVMVSIHTLVLVGVFVFVWSGKLYLALAAIWVIDVARGVDEPMYLIWVNEGLDPRVRATVLSISEQTHALGEVLGGPSVGLIATRYSLPVAMSCSALLLTPVLGLFGFALRRSKDEIVPEAA